MANQMADRRAVLEEMARRPNPPSLETLFRLVKEWGCRVNNLFHRMDGQWQANLRTRDATDYFRWACGPSAPDAMLGALMKVVKAEFVSRPAVGDEDLDATKVGALRVAYDPTQQSIEPEQDRALPDDEDDLIG